MNDQDLKKIFVAHKVDISDDGFSERIIRQLPERRSILPQMVMVVFIMIGLVIIFVVQGVAPILEQINSLVSSICQLQAPSPIAVLTYLGILGSTGIIGYSIAQADAG